MDLALAERTNAVLAAVADQSGDVHAGDLVEQFGKDVYQYLKRLTDSGRIVKVCRGVYRSH